MESFAIKIQKIVADYAPVPSPYCGNLES